MVKAMCYHLASLCLFIIGGFANAAVHGPSTSTSGVYTISWGPVSQIPGRREVLNYEIRETTVGGSTKNILSFRVPPANPL